MAVARGGLSKCHKEEKKRKKKGRGGWVNGLYSISDCPEKQEQRILQIMIGLSVTTQSQLTNNVRAKSSRRSLCCFLMSHCVK